jgi:hypothetical protein
MGQICVDLKGRGRDRREKARAAAEGRRNEEGREWLGAGYINPRFGARENGADLGSLNFVSH